MEYIGKELELFANAINWKKYYAKHLKKYINGNVLEVGSGIGNNTEILINQKISSWTCLEPDSKLVDTAKLNIQDKRCQFISGTTEAVSTKKYDCILYIDVLEHIERDSKETERSFKLLNEGGKLIVLSPAHQFLFSPFDKSVGHYHRYNKKMLTGVLPAHSPEKIFYLDSVGFFASLTNRLFMKSSMPTHQQIAFWDKVLINFSKFVDPLLGYHFGKTIVSIWKK